MGYWDRFLTGGGLFVVGAVLVLGTLLAMCYGPCSWFAGTPAKDIPGRCLGEMVGAPK